MRRRRTLAAVVVVATALAACSTTEDTFLKNSQKGTYLRVPAGWETFRVTGADRPAPSYPAPDWRVVLDASPAPDPKNFASLTRDYPVAAVNVGSIASRDAYVSMQFLRAQATAPLAGGSGGQLFDVIQELQEGNPELELVDYQEYKDADFWGTRIVFNATLENGTTVTIGEVAKVNRKLDTLYQLHVHCLSSCYRSNRAEIDRLLDSFTLKDV